MKRTLLLSLIFAGAILAAVSSRIEARTWTQAQTGRTIEADLIRVNGDQVQLRLSDGRTATVRISTLSKEDQEFIAAGSSSNSAGAGGGANWPAFRGPQGTDISPDTGLLKRWPSGGPKQLWVFKDAGMGYSGYSIVDGKLYTMGTKGNDVHMVCVNIADGKGAWSKSFSNDDQSGYSAGWGHGPRGTPTVSDGMVYGLGPKGTLAAMNAADGTVLWTKNLSGDFGGKAGDWGYSESPLIDGEKLIIAPGGNRAGIVALNKKSGDVIWTADDVKPGKAEYATVLISEINGKRQYVKFFEKSVVSVDAENGSVLWQADFPGGRTAVIPTPIIEGNQVYVTAGYGAGCRAFEISSDFGVKELWENKEMSNHHGGVVKFGDHIYGFDNGKGLVCQDWKDGSNVWMKKERPSVMKGAIHIADGMIYAVNEEDGTVLLIEATPRGYDEKSRFVLSPQSENRNPKGRVWTHPVVIGGKLYLRDQELVHCYDVKS